MNLHQEIKVSVRRIRRKLDRYVALELRACGHEGPLMVAARHREELLGIVAEELARMFTIQKECP